MPPVKITIEVEETVASAYQNATPEEQRKAQERAQRSISRVLLMTPEETGAEFDRITRKSSAYAEGQGWTDDMNDALLRGDDDHE